MAGVKKGVQETAASRCRGSGSSCSWKGDSVAGARVGAGREHKDKNTKGQTDYEPGLSAEGEGKGGKG